MVWFTFTFLLGIPKGDEEKLKDDSKEKQGKSQIDKNYVEIDISKPIFSCHIEYVLVPNEGAKFIDVVCWNKAAKIYFESSTSAIIPLEVEKLKWIHFRVNHNVKLRREDIPLFREHNVKFTVSLGNKKFGEPAKSDKPKKFYGPKFDEETTIRKQLLQPLSENPDDLISVSYFKEHLTPQQQLYIALDTTLETSENHKKLFDTLVELSNEYHDNSLIKIPTPPMEEIPPIINLNNQNQDTGNPKSETAKKTEKKTDAKNKEPDKIEFSITGEQFLSGKRNFENCLKYNSPELPFVFSIGRAKNLLSRYESKLYAPLSVVISKLNNLPVERLRTDGITKIKLRYMICKHLMAESNLMPVDKEMKMNYARTVFTNTIEKEELIYFIQTEGLNIDILGMVDGGEVVPEKVQPEGNQKKGKLLKVPPAEPKFVTLGRVSADISSILLLPHRTSMKCNFEMSNGVSCDWENNNAFTSTNEFNSCKIKKENKYVLNENGVLSPVMTITARLGQSLFREWQSVTMNPELFNRLLVVFYDVSFAVPVIQLIQEEMSEILGTIDYIKNGINLKRPLTKYHTGEMMRENPERKFRMTGFLIDCVDKILLFVESSLFGGIQKVWACTSFMSPVQGHILYDSSVIFLDRLYEKFFQFGGILGINLKQPPSAILANPKSYENQSIPKPAWKALRCISLLSKCKSIKEATRNNLFPDFQSLASLAIEFGVPIQISDKR